MEWTHWMIAALAVYVFGLHVFFGSRIVKLQSEIWRLEHEAFVKDRQPQSPSDGRPLQSLSPIER
jgi:hypothetical protein